jgi:hypothetical protein
MALWESAAFDGRISLSRGIVRLAGDIVICSIDGLRSAAVQNPKLLSLLIRHEQTVYAQAQQSAACLPHIMFTRAFVAGCCGRGTWRAPTL